MYTFVVVVSFMKREREIKIEIERESKVDRVK